MRLTVVAASDATSLISAKPSATTKLMPHMLDRGDLLDLLEEAVVLKRPVLVELRSDKRFVDQVRDVVTMDGEDWAVFKSHEAVPLAHIHCCSRAEPIEPTYAGKT